MGHSGEVSCKHEDALVDYFELVDGIRATPTQTTGDRHRYRVVQRSARVASVIVEGLEDLDFEIVAEDGQADDGGVDAVQFSVVGDLIDAGAKLLTVGLKVIAGKCYLKNKQVATFDPKTGNITGFTNETFIVCPSS